MGGACSKGDDAWSTGLSTSFMLFDYGWLQEMRLHAVTLCGTGASALLQRNQSSAVCYAPSHPALPPSTHPNTMCVLHNYMINGSGD